MKEYFENFSERIENGKIEWHSKYKCDCNQGDLIKSVCMISDCQKVDIKLERNRKIEEILKTKS